jgi:alpha-N-acetylglucosaminidase
VHHGPFIYEISGPTEPGSTLLISGAGLGTVSTVIVCYVSSSALPCMSIKAEQPCEVSVKARLPRSAQAFVGSVTVSEGNSGTTTSIEAVLINAPRVHWRLGSGSEEDGAVNPGGTLHLFGESLAWDTAATNCPHVGASSGSTATVTLVSSNDGRRTQLTPVLASCYRIDVVLPDDLPLTSPVDVWINNGLWNASSAGMLVASEVPVVAAPLWPTREWILGINCSRLSICLSVAWAGAGGIVVVPAGMRVLMQNGEVLMLGPRVQLVGRASATVEWPHNTGGPSNASDGFVTGPGPWQVRGLTLSLPSGMGGAAAIHIPPGSVGCRVDRVLVNSSAPPGLILGAGIGVGLVKKPSTPNPGSSLRRSAMAAKRLGVAQPNNSPVARHWSVTNSVFIQRAGNGSACEAYWPHSDSFFMLSASDGELRGNIWHSACEGYNVDSSSRLFFADNILIAKGDTYSEGNGFSHFSWPQVTEHIYIGNTTQVGNPEAEIRQETMSFDGGPATYYGPHTSVLGAQVTLPRNPIQPDQNYSGLLFHVASGSGVGQMRRVISWYGKDQRHKHQFTSTWTLDSPLDTDLDNTSFVSIGAFCGRIIFEGNSYSNGTQFQLFGTSIHVAVAGNTFKNVSYGMDEIGGCWTGQGCGGMIAWGYSGGNYPCRHDAHGHFPCAPTSWTIEPAFHIVILNNTFTCSKQLASIGPDYNGLPPGTIGPRALGHLHRGNMLMGDVDLIIQSATWSVLLEANTLAPAQCPDAKPAGRLIINASSTRDVFVASPGGPFPPLPPKARTTGSCNASTSTAGLSAADAAAIAAVQGLIARRLGSLYVPCFALELIQPDSATTNDVFELAPAAGGGAVLVRGSSGVALASGIGFYIKEQNCSWAWDRGVSGWTMSALPLPDLLPLPATRRNVSSAKFRYAYNVVTFGYSTWSWTWTDWIEELDKLALWGVNLPLAAVGQEALWLELYTSLGLSQDAVLREFFSGPAFLPWNRMGNIQRSWDAPLSMDWIMSQEALQLKILRRMREFGMQPILPGFAGHVPAALASLFPNASFARSPSWRGFESSYSEDTLLQPSDPLFEIIGKKFYALLASRWNTTAGGRTYFSADVFNEMQPASDDLAYLSDVNARIYGAMAAECPGAVLVMQGWLFLNDHKFWKRDRVRAFLAGVPDESLLILDLASDERVVADQFDSYFGKPWVWNQLQVFGGRRGLYGSLSDTSRGPPAQRLKPNSSCVGIGATPEALEVNPISWDLLWEMAWRSDSPDLEQWVARYASRRYGLTQDAPLVHEAWSILHETQYTQSVGNYATAQLCWLEREPALAYAAAADRVGLPDGIPSALRLLVAAAAAGQINRTQPSFLYDVVDLGRQLVCNIHSDLAILAGWEFKRFAKELHAGAAPGAVPARAGVAVQATQAAVTEIISDLDRLLASHESFLLGNRLEEALKWADAGSNANQTNASKRTLSEASLRYQFLNQITIWGPSHKLSDSSGHNDYAAKNGWAGLVGRYYGGRWKIQAQAVLSAVQSNTTRIDIDAELTVFEEAWSRGGSGSSSSAAFASQPSGDDPLALAAALLEKLAGTAVLDSDYTVINNTDAVPAPDGGGSVDIFQSWNTDTGVLAMLCNLDPQCAGFNTGGWLKTDASHLAPSKSHHNLWVKREKTGTEEGSEYGRAGGKEGY